MTVTAYNTQVLAVITHGSVPLNSSHWVDG